ncbi:hypothetical protein QVD17_17799 [Tagetes erecta]|uniref:Uncharacterized protein n=1 Tax=Tagetes erecta TaxID=13708 RepID=A0AAD8P0K7_TARER|nr:hypothetical protein QVD17_17799 [Tagetes erecta]
MELDFNENNEDDTQDETEMVTPSRTIDENASVPDHDLIASPIVNTPATDDSRRTDDKSSSDHIEVSAAPLIECFITTKDQKSFRRFRQCG